MPNCNPPEHASANAELSLSESEFATIAALAASLGLTVHGFIRSSTALLLPAGERPPFACPTSPEARSPKPEARHPSHEGTSPEALAMSHAARIPPHEGASPTVPGPVLGSLFSAAGPAPTGNGHRATGDVFPAVEYAA